MARTLRSKKRRRSVRAHLIFKPGGIIHPRVQAVGPEHFGIVSVDCAKARSKWMLAEFYGNVLVPPTTVEHNRKDLDAMVQSVRQVIEQFDLQDVIVAIERTGRYHLPMKRTFAQAGFDT